MLIIIEFYLHNNIASNKLKNDIGDIMIINDSIVKKYLNGESSATYKYDEVFNNVEFGKNVFEEPDSSKKDEIYNLLKLINQELNDFHPYNSKLFCSLFPNWKEIIKDVNIKLIVGCQDPYDAFVRNQNDKLYIYFDLIRINVYVQNGIDALAIIRQLLTHELSHVCIAEKYSCKDEDNYVELLKFIVFNEGFAHFLALTDNIEEFNFSEFIEKYYNKSVQRLREALNEKDIEAQKEYLLTSNAGQYWDKFAAIASKLYLANNLNIITQLYNDGIDNLIENILA